jgi:acetylornithine deacetylase
MENDIAAPAADFWRGEIPVMDPHHPHSTDAAAAAVTRWRPLVLDYLDDHVPELVASLAQLIQVPSMSGSEEENSIQAGLAKELSSFGLDVDHWQIPLAQTLAAPTFPGVEVDRDEAWGLTGVARGRGDGLSLMLNVHVDVVPPGDIRAWGDAEVFSGHVDAKTVYGRGACDMKGGLVAALWAVRALTELEVPLRGDLLLSSVQGEEDGGLGTFASLARGWRADACIIPEPTSLDVVPANGGSLTFRLRIQGLAAHASRRTSGVSAVEKFWPVFTALRAFEAERNAVTDPLMARWDIAYPIELGRVTAGDWSSSVPDLLIAEGRYGVALDETAEAARSEFEARIAAVCLTDPWLCDHPVEVEWWGGQFEPGRSDQNSAIITTLRAAHQSVSEHVQQTWGAPYGSDLRLLSGLGGIPTVHYGPGDAALAHSPRERVDIGEVMTTARTLALVAMQYCGVS